MHKALVGELYNFWTITKIVELNKIRNFYNAFEGKLRIIDTMMKMESVQYHVNAIFDNLGLVRENVVLTDDNW